eukprot:CAMPEP_0197715836 /NCGR_PEP_ID=MMETSP1434-20131217/923_1 /TAXON_ID=265543 /ORGANISM="Minutocellus polymorphus, Strain CCMP3303" /LENGTH=366 /DNA_ID=CAMNT_0043300077 /DNA_START=12 /DNA_END=1112 /DNA_ORIENTATION=+
MSRIATALVVVVLAATGLIASPNASAFSAPVTSFASSTNPQAQPVGSILILDHLNINHEKGRHDLLKAFYFDLLRCAVDPRKEENIAKGSKTLWANVGASQFHLPEGKPDAQVFDGLITLSYPNLEGLRERCEDETIRSVLDGTKFRVEDTGGDEMHITCPFGSQFKIVVEGEGEKDPRGVQKGGPSEGLSMPDLTVYVPPGSNFAGIARFYDAVLGAPTLDCGDACCSISVGPRQTLTFAAHPDGSDAPISHDDLRDEGEIEGKPHYLSNYGPHISMYVADLRKCYHKASELRLCYVNPRFKRRSYTVEEAVDECMFRCLDIVDPEDVNAGPILKLEHEIRSVVTRDGSKYKSCPFDGVPEGCVV